MKSSIRILVLGIFVATVAWLSSPPPAKAIPGWARRYDTACITCHVIPPKLNAFGVAFKNNGYRMPQGDEDFVKQPDVSMGAPAWKRVWPKGVWPGAIPDRVPLSVILETETAIDPSGPVKVDFLFPSEFEFIAGGTLGSSVHYLGELAFEFENGETEVEFERGFLGFDNLLNTHLLNFSLGRIETRATPFSRFSHRVAGPDFIVSNFRAVPRGFRFRTRQQGFELWGAKNGPARGGFQYGVGLVNGSGDRADDNSQKDFYASASYKFGGMGVLGPTALKELPTAGRENYVDNSVEIGVLGYTGRIGADPTKEVRFDRFGFKINAYLDRLNLFGAYVRGRDRPLGSPSRLFSNASFVEADVMTYPWLMGILRYDQALGPRGFLRVKRLVPGAAVMIRANVLLKATAEIYVGDNNDLLSGERVNNGAAIGLEFIF